MDGSVNTVLRMPVIRHIRFWIFQFRKTVGYRNEDSMLNLMMRISEDAERGNRIWRGEC